MRIVEGVVAYAQIDVELAAARFVAVRQRTERGSDVDPPRLGNFVAEEVGRDQLLLKQTDGASQLFLHGLQRRRGLGLNAGCDEAKA